MIGEQLRGYQQPSLLFNVVPTAEDTDMNTSKMEQFPSASATPPSKLGPGVAKRKLFSSPHFSSSPRSNKLKMAALKAKYSPDMAPSDFFLFPLMKKPLRGRHFQNDEEVIFEVEHFLISQNADFYKQGLRQVIHHWEKCRVEVMMAVNKMERQINLCQ
ncbi:hypothetical protein ANN_28109 [Periplaneta americana]|uniref:Uncharacterized protein n=1 Tax=Periplaneta americana TaxID=6978 RepID=A0ABQ8RUZ7_PERAM|nr:hypothetical protein ANN_28109 [Periplaneta americana]